MSTCHEKKILSLLSVLLITPSVWAADTDIYGVSTVDVKPNVLIILDNSGSMDIRDVPEDVPGEIYNPNTDYSYTGGKIRNTVYGNGSPWNTIYKNDVSEILCATANNALTTVGYWQGGLNADTSCASDGYGYRYLWLGNFYNFNDQGHGSLKIRMVVAKDVMAQLIYDNYDKVRFGLMKFNDVGTYDQGGYVVAKCGATKESLIGSFNPATTVFTDSDQSGFGAIGHYTSMTMTPLSETLAEAGRYFAGVNSWFNGTETDAALYPVGRYSSTCTDSNDGCQDYSPNSPIEYRCQKNYIILMTDGDPTHDDAKINITDYINGLRIPAAGHNGVANYLDDTAWFLAHNDLMKIGTSPTAADILKKGQPGNFEYQTINTYTVGFLSNQTLLQNTATNGGGVYYTANNASALNAAFNNIISDISSHNEAFSAAAVPVSHSDKAYAGNFVYYGLFQPRNHENWSGNLKKYGITDMGVIKDKNSLDAVSGGAIIDNAQSYWSTTADGPAVTEGGAGEKLYDVLKAETPPRKIYTYTGTNTDLTNTANQFVTTNLTTLQSFNTSLTAPIIASIRHDTDSEWPLGSFLHSQPRVVHYNDGKSMIFAGANDGMLHCFDDSDGSEKWGYIPQDLLSRIHTLPTTTGLQYYVDGSPELYAYGTDDANKILIIGERRGGTSYTALDISSHTAPLFKYTVSKSILGGGSKQLGQSWGTPELVTVKYGTTSKDVFIMSGGYDDNQDNLPLTAADDEGRAVFAIDAATGTLQSNINFNVDNFSAMTHSIIAVSAFENPKSRTTTRIYAGDLGGNLFGFRDDIFNYVPAVDGQEDGVWGQNLKLFSSGGGRKVMYAPNILSAYFKTDITYPDSTVKRETRVGDYLFYGTGDREHPDDVTITNEFYAIKNNWQWKDNIATTSVDESITPSIVKAYVDDADGQIKAEDDNRVLVVSQRDGDGHYISNVAENGELFILNVTDDLLQNKETVEETSTLYTNYIKDAIRHANNRGWYFTFADAGEKIASSPTIFNGVVYFTSFVPGAARISPNDPCANLGSRGTGYLYAIGYKYGDAVMDFDPVTSPDELHNEDRRKKLSGKGIPSEPVIVIHEGKPTIIAGFDTVDPAGPAFSQSVEQFYWRQISD